MHQLANPRFNQLALKWFPKTKKPTVPAAGFLHYRLLGGRKLEMQNPYLSQRLAGLLSILNGVHQSGAGLSSATKGHEREAFVDQFLSKVLPPVYRFGSGDVTDSNGAKSGQLDVVVEYPFAPSLPIVGAGQTRLYLAESVAAVVEVKSNLAGQWQGVVDTADMLAAVRRTFGSTMSMGGSPSTAIPLFAVGYKGWNSLKPLKSHLDSSPNIYGALTIDPPVYVSIRGLECTGPWALWGLICDLYWSTNSLQSATMNPTSYAM